MMIVTRLGSWLIPLAIAIQGGFVGLSLARGIDSAEGARRRFAIAGSAITLATGDPGNDMPALMMTRGATYVLRGASSERRIAARAKS